jgi:1-deoxy-D-xylulose-5-phosphate synthase
MDQAFLRPMPEMVLMAPSDEAELKGSLEFGVSLDTAGAVRYPRDNVPASNFQDVIEPDLREAARTPWVAGRSRLLRRGTDATLIVYGALATSAMEAASELEAEGISVEVVDARFCKPLDGAMLSRVLRPEHPVLTLEDHAIINGFGTAVMEYAIGHGLPTGSLRRLGMPDRLIAHATRPQQLAEVGLDAAGIAQSVRDAVHESMRGESLSIRSRTE